MKKQQTTRNFDFYLRNALFITGVTREELAKHLGVAVPVVNRWLNGSSRPDVDQFREIARYLGVSYEWFLDGKPDALNAEELAERLGLSTETVEGLLALADDEQAEVLDFLDDAIYAMVSAVNAARESAE